MSKGYGRTQRAALHIMSLNRMPLDTFEIAWLAYDIEPDSQGHVTPSDSQLVGLRRALAALAREGKVIRLDRGHNKRYYWALPKYADRPSNSIHIGPRST